MTLSNQRRQNLGYRVIVGSLLGWHPEPCKEKSNKIRVRGSLGARSPAAWPHDPNLLAKPKKADKPHWLQTGDFQAGANVGVGARFQAKMTREMTGGASLTREPGEALFRASCCLDRASFNLVEECVRMAHWERTWVFPVCTVIRGPWTASRAWTVFLGVSRHQ